MSRLEKTISEKYCAKKSKSICKVVFMFTMVIIMICGILLIDYRVNEVLGEDSKSTIIKYLIKED